MADEEKSKNQILQALDALSHTLYQARATRRTTSLALPRTAGSGDGDDDAVVGADDDAALAKPRPLSRRFSLMSPFRTRPKLDKDGKGDEEEDDDNDGDVVPLKGRQGFAAVTLDAASADEAEKKGLWSWRPIRALAHIGMHRVGCLFSVEVVAAQGLPPSMNGLRLAVAVRRKEARDGALQTMPARVHKGAADFDETLYVRCHLHCTGGGATGKPLRFEPRPFLLSAVAVDAPELDFGKSSLDLGALVKEFTDKCQQGANQCLRQWDMAFPLAGKAKGGELVIKLAFQIMDDAGLGLIYNQQPDGEDKTTNSSSSVFARKLSKSSFSIMSPKMIRSKLSLTPKMRASSSDLKELDNFKLDEPTPAAVVEKPQKEPEPAEPEPEKAREEQQKEPKPEPEPEKAREEQAKEPEGEPEEVREEQQKEAEHGTEQVNEEQPKEPEDVISDDSEILEFDVVDKGIEGQEEKVEPIEQAEAEEEHLITSQAKALEATVLGDVSDAVAGSVEPPPEEAAVLDANEEKVAGESPVQPPEQGDDNVAKSSQPRIGWRTIAIVVTPIAIIVSKTLAGAR